MIGLFIAGLGLILVAQAVEWAGSWAGRELSDRVEATLLSLFDSDEETSRRSLFVVDAQGRPDRESLDSFAAQAHARYGRARAVSIVNISPGPGDREVAAAATLHFDREKVLTTVRLRLVPGSADDVALLGVQLLDRTRGDLAVGDLGDETRPIEPAPPLSASTTG